MNSCEITAMPSVNNSSCISDSGSFLPPNTIDLENFQQILPNNNDDDNDTTPTKNKKRKKDQNKRTKRKSPSKPDQDDLYTPTKKYDFDQRFQMTIEYRDFMTAIVNLIEQKERALDDLQFLEIQYKRFLSDPKGFKSEILPDRQNVVEVPMVNFLVYESLPNEVNESPKPGDLIRGKKYSSSKPISFNRPWTFEEQRRLEELLNEYPDEPISAYRWERIARALGNRTPKQVSSRVQKYFLRLAQKGIPVPGKIPKTQNNTKEKSEQPLAATQSPLSSGAISSTFNSFDKPSPPLLFPPSIQDVDLTDEEILGENATKFASLRHVPEYQELIRLKKLKLLEQSSREVYIDPPPPLCKNASSSSSSTDGNYDSDVETEMLYLNPNYMPD